MFPFEVIHACKQDINIYKIQGAICMAYAAFLSAAVHGEDYARVSRCGKKRLKEDSA